MESQKEVVNEAIEILDGVIASLVELEQFNWFTNETAVANAIARRLTRESRNVAFLISKNLDPTVNLELTHINRWLLDMVNYIKSVRIKNKTFPSGQLNGIIHKLQDLAGVVIPQLLK